MSDLSDADAAAIERLWTEYGRAVGAGDTGAIAGLFTSDGDMIAIDGTHARGPDGIASYYDGTLAGALKGASIQDVELARPRPLGRDAALMNATWMVHGLAPKPFRVRTTFLVVREATGWRYAAVRFAAAQPRPSVADREAAGRLETPE
jgi:uncharacterized protein (TIGR02246 family)